ncbi:unnamed protein product [Caenorhabditis auriculariae]|uniref:Uncharacterized protein n=1 Tax=Caenorhabditis auriculariae TaxID=2777116 RepID=A0A8S1HHV0_9PELO|nr:unnamed protein product [Caenorhabditis auriculariae]
MLGPRFVFFALLLLQTVLPAATHQKEFEFAEISNLFQDLDRQSVEQLFSLNPLRAGCGVCTLTVATVKFFQRSVFGRTIEISGLSLLLKMVIRKLPLFSTHLLSVAVVEVSYLYLNRVTSRDACAMMKLCSKPIISLPLPEEDLPADDGDHEKLILQTLSTPANGTSLSDEMRLVASTILGKDFVEFSDQSENFLYSFAHAVEMQMKHILEREETPYL